MDKLDELNARQASDFLASKTDLQLKRLLTKYAAELDETIRSDMVKLGMYLKLREEGVPAVWAKGRACRNFARRANKIGRAHV